MTYTAEYNAQRDAITTALATVANIGRVHDRPRLGDFRSRWTTQIGAAPEIRAWEVQAGTVNVVRREQGRRHRYRNWIINGVLGLADLSAENTDNPAADLDPDASWHEINRLAGEAADALDAAREAWVAADTFIDTDPTEIGEPTVIQIGGGPICWGVTLTIRGYTIVTP